MMNQASFSKYTTMRTHFKVWKQTNLHEQNIGSMKPHIKQLIAICMIVFASLFTLNAQKFGYDVYQTSEGKLSIYFIGHGTLMFDFAGKTIHVDPWSKLTDYSVLPKADLIFITHQHGDHYDSIAINQIWQENTILVLNSGLQEKLNKGDVMKNGDSKIFSGIKVEAVPAYNITSGRENYHPKGRDNGYVFNFGNRRVYVAGDTENIPEMSFLKNIYIAFLPMNQPYTMLPEQVVEAVDRFEPQILYPYHYGETDLEELKTLMKAQPETRLMIRQMK